MGSSSNLGLHFGFSFGDKKVHITLVLGGVSHGWAKGLMKQAIICGVYFSEISCSGA